MRFMSSTLAAMVLAAMISLTPTAPAKADGGVVAGAAIYLGADFLVGRKCGIDAWPFNIVTELGGLLHGRDFCYRGGYYGHPGYAYGAYPVGYGYYHRRHYYPYYRHHRRHYYRHYRRHHGHHYRRHYRRHHGYRHHRRHHY
jgi:hypothetical protein